jgi:hypothetical protein
MSDCGVANRGQSTREHADAGDKKQLSQNSGSNQARKVINRLLLMGEEHPSSVLIQLRMIGKTSSGPDGVLHDAPEAIHGVEASALGGGVLRESTS